MSKKPIVLVVSGARPPFARPADYGRECERVTARLCARGYDVEVIAQTDNGEEFMHLDGSGALVHRINPDLSYAFKALKTISGRLADPLEGRNFLFAARALEKTLELTRFWGREILWIETTNGRNEALFLSMIPSLVQRLVVRTVSPLSDQEPPPQPALPRAQLYRKILQRLARHEESTLAPQSTPLPRFPFPYDFEANLAWRPRPIEDDRPLRIGVIGKIERWNDLDPVLGAALRFSHDTSLKILIHSTAADAEAAEHYRARAADRFPGIERAPIQWRPGPAPDDLSEFDAVICPATKDALGFGLIDMLASGIPTIARQRLVIGALANHGIHTSGTFDDAASLALVLAELRPRLKTQTETAGNRTKLRALFEDSELRCQRFIDEALGIPAPRPSRAEPEPIRSLDVICCSYNRFDEITISLPSILREAKVAEAAGIACKVWIVYQNEGFPERLREWRSDWKDERLLQFIYSSPPGLTRARNEGIAASKGDLVLFIDDDVILEPGFFLEHIRAANEHSHAVGVAGRLCSPAGQGADRRAIGQIRISGMVEPNFDSPASGDLTIVPHTPMGANMSYRRARMARHYDNAWFDERMPPAAFRDETLLGAELFRAGEHLVYAPRAQLFHFESASGGCGFRSRRPIGKLIDHFAMDYLFLHRLYEPVSLARRTAPWLLFKRDMDWALNRRTAIKKTIVNIGGYFRGRALYFSERPARPIDRRPQIVR